jgi:hypothetical protein
MPALYFMRQALLWNIWVKKRRGKKSVSDTLKGRTDEALAHFRWVKEHGTPSFIEIAIAAAELDRLEMAPKAPKP